MASSTGKQFLLISILHLINNVTYEMRRVVSHSKKVRTYIMDETKQDMNIEIGKRLQGLREKKNLSQASFIKEMELRDIDIARSTYSRYECGGTPIPLFYVKEF